MRVSLQITERHLVVGYANCPTEYTIEDLNPPLPFGQTGGA